MYLIIKMSDFMENICGVKWSEKLLENIKSEKLDESKYVADENFPLTIKILKITCTK